MIGSARTSCAGRADPVSKAIQDPATHDSVLPATMIRYAEGDGVNLGDAKNVESSFRKLALSLSKPVVTRETFAKYKTLPDAEQHRLKRIAGWMIRAPISGGKRSKDSVEPGRLITLDIDKATPGFMEQLLAGEVFTAYTMAVHTTRSHTPENPRVRIILIAKTAIPPDDYQRVVRILSQILDPDMHVVDKVSARVAQLMYRPSCSADMEKHFRYYEQLGQELDWEQMVEDWEVRTGLNSRDITKLPRFADEAELREVAEKVEDPLTKKGPVGYFCRAYSISDLVLGKDGEAPILDGIYEVSEWNNDGTPKRMSYLLGHSQNGVVLYNNDTLCYSHHGSDPAGDKTLNAFDLVRYHKFDAAQDDMNKPMAQRESWKPMVDWCKGLPAYKRQQGLDNYDMEAMLDDADDMDWVEGETADDLLGFDHLMAEERQKRDAADEAELDDLLGVPVRSVVAETAQSRYQRLRAEKPPKAWIATELELSLDGTIKPTLTNVAIIVGNDSRLWRKIAYNEFSNQIVLLSDIKTRNSRIPSIICRDKERGQNWSDINDIVIRAIIEGPAGPGLPGYGMKVSDRDLVGGVKLAARRNSFHPIRDMIARWRALGWDGKDRLGDFFHRFLGAEKSIYTADVMKMMLIASIARIETPGCKFDYACILEGLTGIGKSTLIKVLYGEEYFGELDCDPSDRQQVAEQIAGNWALEMPELGAMNKADHNHMKALMRRQFDDVRMAYDRTVSELPRQCVIWGTTNDDSYLRDPTGNRSYWIIKCGDAQIDFAAVLRERDQLWAQAVFMHDEMRARYPNGDLPLTLTGEALIRARELQEGARQREMWEDWVEDIIEWANRPVHKGKLFADMGVDNAEGVIGDDDNDYVVRVAFNQHQAAVGALGLREGAFTNPTQQSAWNKTKAALLKRGFSETPNKSGQTRVAGKVGRWIFLPGAADANVRKGYFVSDEAEPTRDSKPPEHEDLI
jgi:putative DNA primase/helicase